MNLKKVNIYTDGACAPISNNGGWGVVLTCESKVAKGVYGFCPHTTSNIMEMRAVSEGLNTLNQKCKVVVHTDSTYVFYTMTQWRYDWVQSPQNKNIILNKNKTPVKNIGVIRKIWEKEKYHEIEWKLVGENRCELHLYAHGLSQKGKHRADLEAAINNQEIELVYCKNKLGEMIVKPKPSPKKKKIRVSRRNSTSIDPRGL